MRPIFAAMLLCSPLFALCWFATGATEEPDPIGRQAAFDLAAERLLTVSHLVVPYANLDHIEIVVEPREGSSAKDLSRPGADRRLYGTYQNGLRVTPEGFIVAWERITLYVPPGCENQITKILAHEYLHALYERLVLIDPDIFKPIPTERFVQRLLPGVPPVCEGL